MYLITNYNIKSGNCIMRTISLKNMIFSLFLFSISAFTVAAPGGNQSNATQKLDVSVSFVGNFGSTITDDSGTYFNINFNSYLSYIYESLLGIQGYDPYNGIQMWQTVYEPKVYIEAYQVGSRDYLFTTSTTVEDVLNDPDAGVPLYFFGTEAQVTIAVTNNGPQAKAKVQVVSEAFILNTDGTNGTSFGNQLTQDLEIARGETAYIDASFFANVSPELDSGLDRFSIKISHANNNNGNNNAGLIAEYEAIFCPPEYEEALADQAPSI